MVCDKVPNPNRRCSPLSFGVSPFSSIFPLVLTIFLHFLSFFPYLFPVIPPFSSIFPLFSTIFLHFPWFFPPFFLPESTAVVFFLPFSCHSSIFLHFSPVFNDFPSFSLFSSLFPAGVNGPRGNRSLPSPLCVVVHASQKSSIYPPSTATNFEILAPHATSTPQTP